MRISDWSSDVCSSDLIGVIQGYHARLDPFRLDIGLVLFVEVTLEGHRPDEQARFEAAIEALPQVVEASHVSGDVDYLLKIVVANMMEWRRLREQFVGGDLGVDPIGNGTGGEKVEKD